MTKLQQATVVLGLVIAWHIYRTMNAALLVHDHLDVLRNNYSNNNNNNNNDVSPALPSRAQISSMSATLHLKCIDPVQLCRDVGNQTHHYNQSDGSTRRTLAMGDPSLRGGFRNQYMRFTSLIAHAWRYGYPEILLPSIKWFSSGSMVLNMLREEQDKVAFAAYSTVPFQYLYSVDHWNLFFDLLPKMVDYAPDDHSQWNPDTTVYYNLCNTTEQWYKRPPKTDLSPFIDRQTHPVGMGGGYGIGKLWEHYRREYDLKGTIPLPNGTLARTELLERTMAEALRPSSHMQAILDQLPKRPNHNYLAFHARFEPEMLVHGMCQDWKERDLGKVVEWIRQEPDFGAMDSMFIAIAMPQMKESYRFNHYKDEHKKNTEILDNILKQGLSSNVKVWMAGEDAVEPHVDPCMLQLVSSFINLELAVNAKYFLGTATSTWSIGVWKLRYFRGLPNYEYTPQGIRKVEGLPKPFKCR
jgi:hypothetical protein